MEKDSRDVKLKRQNEDDLQKNEGNVHDFVFIADSDDEKGGNDEAELSEAFESCKPDAWISGGQRSHMYRNKSAEDQRASL